MKCYHGSITQGIQTLQPFANPDSNLQYPCVYLSTSEALAAVYLWNRPYKWMTFEINQEGIPVYYETFPHALQHFYQGVQGCIYTCEGEFLVDEKTNITLAVISKDPVPVSHCKVVEDAYALLLQHEASGGIILERYETLSDKRRQANTRMIRSTISRMNLLEEKSVYAPFVKETFPELWEEAKRLATLSPQQP